MNAGHTVRSDTKHPASSHVSTRLWNLPAYGKPLRSSPFHTPWKTPPIHRPRLPQLPQPPPLEEKKPEPNEESGSSSSTHDSHIAWYQNRGHVSSISQAPPPHPPSAPSPPQNPRGRRTLDVTNTREPSKKNLRGARRIYGLVVQSTQRKPLCSLCLCGGKPYFRVRRSFLKLCRASASSTECDSVILKSRLAISARR